jgi:hypothetical protein
VTSVGQGPFEPADVGDPQLHGPATCRLDGDQPVTSPGHDLADADPIDLVGGDVEPSAAPPAATGCREQQLTVVDEGLDDGGSEVLP